MLVNGQWVEALAGGHIDVINPADESVLATVSHGRRADADRAVAAAVKAFSSWSKTTAYDRAKLLKKTAELIRERADSLARTMTMEQGKPVPEAKAEVLQTADTFEWYAEEAKRAYGRTIPPSNGLKRHMAISHPVGVVGTITPWNFPMALASRKIAPALAAGCTVVSRPADQTPLSLIGLYECLHEAGLPEGVANLYIGSSREFADALFAEPAVRKISFTGSTEVGKELIRRSADGIKRVSMELGGHAPLIVFPDADVAQVAQAAVLGKFRNNGQVCISPSRFFIHEKIRDEFTEAAVTFAKGLKMGNGLEPGTQVGPMFEARALAKAQELVDDARARGAAVLTGGCRSSKFDRE
jgi:succinate-semialdehyde dehydrogenase/glutarate-semialdehyde dehydrogenase